MTDVNHVGDMIADATSLDGNDLLTSRALSVQEDRRRIAGCVGVNKLYFGDNLEVIREHIATESVDLIYLDPPFNSQASYNVLFKTRGGKSSEAQAEAFRDTWEWGDRRGCL